MFISRVFIKVNVSMWASIRQARWNLCLFKYQWHHDKLLRIQPHLLFSEVAKSLKNRLNFHMHMWKWNGLIFTMSQNTTSTSFVQLLSQSGGNLCTRTREKLAGQAPWSSWAAAALCREIYSCSQLVARRGCNTKHTDQSCAGLFCNNIIYYYFFFSPKSPRGLKEFVICSWLVLHKRLSWDLTYKEAFSSFLSLIAL